MQGGTKTKEEINQVSHIYLTSNMLLIKHLIDFSQLFADYLIDLEHMFPD